MFLSTFYRHRDLFQSSSEQEFHACDDLSAGVVSQSAGDAVLDLLTHSDESRSAVTFADEHGKEETNGCE